MANKKNILYGILSIVLLNISNNKKSRNNQEEKIKRVVKHFNKNGIIMFGRDTCPACIKQKAEFEKHFSKIQYNQQLPREIKWLPTFANIINNEYKILLEGYHSIDSIIEKLGIN